MKGNTSSGESNFSQPKKAKLSDDLIFDDNFLSSSPDLHHKLPSKSGQHQHEDSENTVSEVSEDTEDQDTEMHTNMFGKNFVMWFEIGIEGKSPMDEEENDWGGRIEFGFKDNNFPKDVEDYFLLYEDECTLDHLCAGRVMGVLSHFRGKVIEAPSYDPRDIVELLDKYRDAHISDSGWREVDPEEWVA